MLFILDGLKDDGDGTQSRYGTDQKADGGQADDPQHQQTQQNQTAFGLLAGKRPELFLFPCGLDQLYPFQYKLQNRQSQTHHTDHARPEGGGFAEGVALEQEKKDLEQFKEYVKTDEYAEKIAREKFGLVYKGEIIFEPESEK